MKVEIGGFVVHVDTVDELREVMRSFSGVSEARPDTVAAVTRPATAIAEQEALPIEARPPHVKTPRGARFVPTEVKIRSANKREALLKLYKGLENTNHKDALRYLAGKGEEGASIENLKEALRLPANYKFGGLTAGLRRRAPSYGLDPEDVLIVEYRGIVANTRILDYRLGPEMLEMMIAEGLVMKAKGGKDSKEE